MREPTRVKVMEALHKLGCERSAIAGSLRSERTCMVALSIPGIIQQYKDKGEGYST